MRKKIQLKQFFGAVLAVVMAGTAVTVVPKTALAVTNPSVAAATEYGLMEDVQDGVILHCWNWSFNNMKEQMAEIAAAGYTAIQTSPIQAAKERTDDKTNDGWWILYQPKSFEIDNSGQSALGTKAEFEAMCEEAHKYGIKVIVDVVANHLGNKNGYDKATVIDSDIRDDASCWHEYWDEEILDYNDRYRVTHMSMSGLPDLNTESDKIQGYVLEFLKECIDSGADGFRFDAAKHINVSAEGEEYDFWENTLEKAKVYAQETREIDLYAYGEILYDAGTNINGYTKYMSVTENQSSNDVRHNVAGGNAAGAASNYYAKGVLADKLVLWAESHDTYSNDSKESTNVSVSDINKTWAIVASRADAASLYFARSEGHRSGDMGEIGTWDWKNEEVIAVNKFHNFFNGESEYLASSGSIAYNERGTSGVVLVNCNGTTTNVNVKANRMADGTYKDQITDSTFTVSGGYIQGQIGSTGIAVVYNDEVKPTPTISVAGGTFSADTLTLTVGLKHATSGTYKIGNAAAVTYTSSKTITIGNGMNVGDSVKVVLTATDGTAVETVTYTFTKVEKSENVVYIDLPDGWTDSVYCYVYDELLDIQNSTFPGELMTYDAVTGYYRYEIPETIKNPRVIFYNSNTNRYPADGQPGLKFTGDNVYTDGKWIEYTDYVYDKGVYFDNTDGWSVVNAYVWNDSGTYSGWPGVQITQMENGYYGLDLGDYDAKYVIFNNGSDQTDDLDYVTNGLYTINGLQSVLVKEEKLSGLNQAKDGKWYYYTDGKVDTSYTAITKNGNEFWYIKNGQFADSYTGMYLYDGQWVYINKGKLDKTYTGLAKNSAGWWYVKNGVLDRTYTGMVEYGTGIWYVKSGKLNSTYTGMYLYDGQWIYIKNGRYDRTYTGLAKNSTGWWYMKNGVLDRTYTGMVEYGTGVWYVKSGKLNSTYTGMYLYNGQWVYINNGRYDRAYTGLAQNSAGWWYMKDGVLDRTYTGMVAKAGEVWYVKSGKFTTTYTGMALYNGQWVYVNSGKFDKTFTGIAQNSYGLWYMKNGVLDRTYTGKITFKGTSYTVTNGKAIKYYN